MSKIINLKDNKKYLVLINQEIFQVSLLIYLVIILVENFQKGVVSDFFNFNWILWIVIISGILMVPCSEREDEQIATNQAIGWRGRILLIILIILAIISAMLIFVKIKDLGWLALAVSILGGLIIFLISYLISHER